MVEMGCAASIVENDSQSPAKPAVVAPKTTKSAASVPSPVAPTAAVSDVKWETNPEWAEEIMYLMNDAIATGAAQKFRDHHRQIFFKLAQDYLAKKYPECAEVGSMRAMDPHTFAMDGVCQDYPEQLVLVLDDAFQGTVYSVNVLVGFPLHGDESSDPKDWLVPGSLLDSPQMRSAKRQALEHMKMAALQGGNYNHAVLNIFMGADLVTCKFIPSTTEPTVIPICMIPTDEHVKLSKDLYKSMKQNKNETRGLCIPLLFGTMMRGQLQRYPGTTVWDEGPLPFTVNGKPYPYSTRVLVTRRYHQEQDDAKSTVYHVNAPTPSSPNDPRLPLLRNQDSTKDPGGVLSVTLFVAIDPDIVWPKLGQFKDTPAHNAAGKAIVKHVTAMNKEGRVEKCDIQVEFGIDVSRFKFVGERFPFNSNGTTTLAAAEAEKDADENNLTTFSIKLEKQQAHNLWNSESQFQAMKLMLKERAQQNPELYAQRAVQVSTMAGLHLLECNFPNCEVSEEGDFSTLLTEEAEILIPGTKLLVARDPKQEPNRIVAALHTVPKALNTDSGHWLDTPEMKNAETMLMNVLKKLRAEGQVSEIDCMALVTMGTDATIYQFVDGDKFVDYSDERNAQFTWG